MPLALRRWGHADLALFHQFNAAVAAVAAEAGREGEHRAVMLHCHALSL
jgi:hypothetical protein